MVVVSTGVGVTIRDEESGCVLSFALEGPWLVWTKH